VRSKEKLWGLIVCHHYQCPHRVAYYQRSAAEFLVRIFASQLGRTLQMERNKLENSLLGHQAVVCSCLRYLEEIGGLPEHVPKMMASALFAEPGSTSLPLVANAGGAALILGDSVLCAGKCPGEDDIKCLVTWMQSTGAALEVVDGAATFSSARRLPLGGIWATHGLRNEGFPGAEALKECASGILAVDVALLDLPTYDGRGGQMQVSPGCAAGKEGVDCSGVDGSEGGATGPGTHCDTETSGVGDAMSAGSDASPPGKTSTCGAYHRSVQPAVLVFFRGENLKEEAWAGNMNQPQGRHQGVEMTPRESFKVCLALGVVPWNHEYNHFTMRTRTTRCTRYR
jgi:light-regulated signal transduction histidine kinase (bacteriophytochrome)